jgi:hypothetical protein
LMTAGALGGSFGGSGGMNSFYRVGPGGVFEV